MNKQSGRTSKQMIEAPKNAWFVWVNGMLTYPTSLARHLGRTDLTIVPPHWIELGIYRQHRFTAIVFDHAFHSTDRSDRVYDEAIFAALYARANLKREHSEEELIN